MVGSNGLGSTFGGLSRFVSTSGDVVSVRVSASGSFLASSFGATAILFALIKSFQSPPLVAFALAGGVHFFPVPGDADGVGEADFGASIGTADL